MTKENKLTDEEIQYYLESCGVNCPKCKSHDIQSLSNFKSDFVGINIEQDLECLTCGFQWTDVYKLHSIKKYGGHE